MPSPIRRFHGSILWWKSLLFSRAMEYAHSQFVPFVLTAQSHLKTKSKLFVTDQKSKKGTKLDEEDITGQTKELSGEEHTIQVGLYQHALR